MYIIIIGLGGIGKSLATIASEHGDNVVVIDKDENRCNEILEHIDVMAITGNSTDKSILEDAGIDRADALITTTSDDAVNLMTCWLAKRFEVKNLISIVNQIEHSELFKEVGVRISENPDELVANRLYYWSENPNMEQLAMIPGGTIFEMTVDENAPFVDHEIKELDVTDFVFIAIIRVGKDIIIPNGTVRIRPNDRIMVFTKKQAEEECIRTLNKQLKSPK
ncbi:TrkA family potassium uptake protein [Methanomicrobium antiquum]|uniref:TrkA family potassium uptake protein n=1 Tax=Methanomicrobium antiquum TaxID=487686 RepID=A0AAF0JNL1_9EURY|nr:TrkA family potassium uptake protein [Methanomicrobium antiquum]WFN37690.1 TrkA family potassium uptake protein [Methanomicrobium antiquum]